MPVKDYIAMMRPHQWYKNLLVFLAIVVVEIPHTWPWERMPAVFVLSNYPPLIVGFLVLCAVSSAGYIVNDVFDMEKDAAHPEKRERPLPSGRAMRRTALALATVLYGAGLPLSYLLNPMFFILVLLYMVNAHAYNLKLREWPIIDVCTIAVGFVIRAVAGTFLLGVPFTSWLIIGVFFVALVLGFGKRKNELQLLGEEAALHKPVFRKYDHMLLDHAITMSATWVVMFYALYCYNVYGSLMSQQPIMLTVPIAAGIVLRYVYLIHIGSPVGRKPHLAVKDRGLVFGGVLFGFTLILTLFFWVPLMDAITSVLPPVSVP